MKWRFAGSVLLLTGALTTAGAQQDPQADPFFKIPPPYRGQIQVMIDSADLLRLPGKALRLKAIEGWNKKKDGRQVLTVVRNLYGTMRQSREALGPLASMEDVDAGAYALQGGLRPQDLAQFKVSAAGRSPTRVLTYLTDLVANRNVPAEEAVPAFAKVWADGAADSDLEGLWRAIDQDILSGVNPKSALSQRTQSFPRRKPPESNEGNPHS